MGRLCAGPGDALGRQRQRRGGTGPAPEVGGGQLWEAAAALTIRPGAAARCAPKCGRCGRGAEAAGGGSASTRARCPGSRPARRTGPCASPSRVRPLPCLRRSSGDHTAEPHSSLRAQPGPPRLWEDTDPHQPCPTCVPKKPIATNTSSPCWATFGISVGVTVAVGVPSTTSCWCYRSWRAATTPRSFPTSAPCSPCSAACRVCPAPGEKKGSATIPASAAEHGGPGPPARPQRHSGSGAGKFVSTTLRGAGELGMQVLLPPRCPEPLIPPLGLVPFHPSLYLHLECILGCFDYSPKASAATEFKSLTAPGEHPTLTENPRPSAGPCVPTHRRAPPARHTCGVQGGHAGGPANPMCC